MEEPTHVSRLQELRIPHMGSVENAKLVTWRVSEGEPFKSGQVLYEVETDKTVTEVEADADGVLARRDADEGDEKKTGDLIGYVAVPGTTAEVIQASLAALGTSETQTVTGERDDANVVPRPIVDAPAAEAGQRHSPYARRLAAEHNVDLAHLKGTGPGGRITGEDVLLAARKSPASLDRPISVQQREPSGSEAVPRPPGYDDVAVEVVANSSRRRAISRRLAESARTCATLTADMQVDLTAVFAERARIKAQGGTAPSVLAYFAHAACRVLRLHPEFNASFTDTHTLLWKPVNLGIAVDTPAGLVVPVIRHADTLSVADIHAAVHELAQRARDGQLLQSELEGGTFTVSNPGALGPVLRAEAIINWPQVAILGLPGVVETPIAVEKDGHYSVVVRSIIRPSLSFDHRALDGGQVVAFLNDLKRLLEEPAET
jgi:pyruvate/2-oxoglutarate dehydrogenase complex dihydrolipoamide acyltransferase (E2) component